MENTWKTYTEMPNEGEYVMVFSVFYGVKVGWFRNGAVETVWSHGEKINWSGVSKWMVVPEITLN